MSHSQQMVEALDRQELEEAEVQFQQALLEDSEAQLLDLGQYLESMGFYPQAKEIYEQIAETYPEVYLSLATILAEEGQTEEAFAYLEEIGPESNWYVASLLVKADLYQLEGLADVAREKLVEAAHLSDDPIIQLGLAEIDLELERYQEAIQEYAQLDNREILEACGVPAIMSSRTIENERDRKITIMTATFMPCSAKLEIIALIAGAFFPDNPWVAPSTYFLGMTTIILSGIALKKTRLLGGLASPFIMELPAYHWPKALSVFRYAFGKAMSFVKRAGTIIFSLTILIWFLSSYNFSLQAVHTDHSILASLGKSIAWIFEPLGFGNWKATVAAVTGLAAKETVVATFGILYNDSSTAGLSAALRVDYTSLAAYSFLTFNLLCAPCFAAMGAIKREMGDLKWTMGAIGFQTGLAYVVSLVLYQLGLVFLLGQPITIWTGLAVLLLVGMLYFILRKPHHQKETVITLDTLANAHL